MNEFANKPLVPTRNGEAPLLAAQRRRWAGDNRVQRILGYSTLYVIGAFMLCVPVSSCGDADSRHGQFDRSQWPHAVIRDGDVLELLLPHEQATMRSAENEAVQLSISPELKPELHFNATFGRTIYLHVELNTLPVRSQPPPIPREIAENVKIYSLLLERRSVEDPKVRKEIYDAMEYSRRNKRVRYMPDEPVAISFSELRDHAFFGRGKYLADGEVDGLSRWSSLRCFSESELAPDPAEPRYLGWKFARKALERKAADDPSPAGCIVNRYSAIYMSAASEDKETWVVIECRPVLQNCVASFVAAKRWVEVDFDNYDIQHWRQIVEPVRSRTNQLVR